MDKSILKFKEQEEGSIICLLGGDQTRIWAQELSVIKSSITLKDAILLFEIYNRANDEYNNNNFGYLGLDNLAEEVEYARKQMNDNRIDTYSYEQEYNADSFIEYMRIILEKEEERYGDLKKYLPESDCNEIFEGNFTFKDLLYKYAISEEKYYWVDQCRVSKKDFEFSTGLEFNHWYEIAELYDPSEKLPFDFFDEEIVSIFGFKKFKAFGDLSYGC